MISVNKDTVLVFDLDDTIYAEQSFEISGKCAVFDFLSRTNQSSVDLNKLKSDIINLKGDWIGHMINLAQLSIEKEELLNVYRNHTPEILLYNDFKTLISRIDSATKFALITDGRSITQRNKIAALGLAGFFDPVIISEEIGSEKPGLINYKLVHDHFPNSHFFYFGDNPQKDFVTPNSLGWTTVCMLDRGKNIHQQNFNLPHKFLPKYTLKSFSEIVIDG